MTDDFIAISTLNDYVFCPYSIYLHNVYMDTDSDTYYAMPQILGAEAHSNVDNKTTSTKKNIIESMGIVSYKYRLIGKIDIYNGDLHLLIERKNNLKNIFIGQIYQLWAQYLCMIEMGYIVDKLCFYEISTKKYSEVTIPKGNDLNNFVIFLNKYRNFDPRNFTPSNLNKCAHCVYCGLCDKYTFENVY